MFSRFIRYYKLEYNAIEVKRKICQAIGKGALSTKNSMSLV